jgi:pimeloyl-ACP methyl ester carboxylesterase
MRPHAQRSLLAFVACCLPLATAAATEHHKTAPDSTLDAYAKPAERIEIAPGRHLNLRCSGSGSPTVVLEAGFAADSLAWAQLQPKIAKEMRVCSYDRAGYGFSDAGPMPRDLEAEVGDLHLLLQAAHIATPAIFVGHSMGTNLIRRYDQLHPGDVAAMVLVDPPPQHIAEFSPAYAKVETEMAPAMFQAYRNCEQGAKDGRLAAPPPALQDCLRGPDPRYGDALNASIRANHSTPAFWASMISGAEGKGAVFEAPVAADETHGDKPLLVLTAANAYADADPGDRKALEAAQDKTHAAIAATSTRGERIRVEGASHELQADKPEAVLDAIRKVRKQLDTGQ